MDSVFSIHHLHLFSKTIQPKQDMGFLDICGLLDLGLLNLSNYHIFVQFAVFDLVDILVDLESSEIAKKFNLKELIKREFVSNDIRTSGEGGEDAIPIQ